MIKNQNTAAMIVRASGLLLGAVATVGFARVLQPEKFGAYSFVMAVVAILSIPQVAALRQTLIRELAYGQARGPSERVDGIWRWVLVRAIWITLIVISLAGLWVFLGVQDPALRWHLTLGLVVYVLLPTPHLLSGVLQGLGQPLRSQLPEFLLRPLLTLAVLGVIWSILPEGTISVAMALAITAAALIADAMLCLFLLQGHPVFRLWPRHTPPLREESRALYMSALSFGAIAGVFLINSNLDVFMLGLLRSDGDVGLYKAAVVLSTLAAFGLGVVNAIIMPQIAKLHAQGDNEALQMLVTRSARIIGAFALLGVLIIGPFGDVLLREVFDSSYGGGYLALVILTAGQFMNALFGPVAVILNMTGHQRITLIGMSLSVALNALLNLLLVPRFGIEGAAVATTVSLVVWNVLLATALKRRTGYVGSIWARRG